MVMLVVSLLLASQFLKLFPDSDNARLSERKFTVETLAVHVAMELDNSSGQGSDEISELLRSTVQRTASLNLSLFETKMVRFSMSMAATTATGP